MSVKNTEERKQIERQMTKLDAEIAALEHDRDSLEGRLHERNMQHSMLRKRLEALKPKAITISDHAIVRYLERKAGFDIEAIRKSILESDLQAMVGALGGSGKFPINGYQVVLKDYTVVTIN